MLPTRVVDRADHSLPYSYFSVRIGMLVIVFASLVAWTVTGFNVIEGAVPLIGIQWSTFATFAFFFYGLVVNLQVGGLKSGRQVWSEVKYDLIFLFKVHDRNLYRNQGAVDGVRASLYAFCVCISCLFLFEVIWVPLYDYFQFGSVVWPVYMAHTPGLLSGVLARNVLMFVIGALLGPFIFFAFSIKSIDAKGNPTYRYSLIPRTGLKAIGLAGIASLLWLAWIVFPHSFSPITEVIGPMAKTYSSSGCYVYPSQAYFPQNTYTFYPCADLGKSYPLTDILGFFNPDNAIHAVNVLTKFATFGAFSYPFMVKVKT